MFARNFLIQQRKCAYILIFFPLFFLPLSIRLKFQSDQAQLDWLLCLHKCFSVQLSHQSDYHQIIWVHNNATTEVKPDEVSSYLELSCICPIHYHCMKKSSQDLLKNNSFCVSERRPYRFGATWEWVNNDGVTVNGKSWWLCLGCVPSTSLPPSLKVKTSHERLHPPLSSPSDLYVPLLVHFPFSFFVWPA